MVAGATKGGSAFDGVWPKQTKIRDFLLNEKATSVTEHLGADHGADSGPALDVEEVAKCKGKKKLFVLLAILVLGGVGVAIWKKRSAQADDAADQRDEARFAGSMP